MEQVMASLPLVLATVVALLPIVNPFSTAPIFLAITEGYSEERRRAQALRGVLYMFAILTTFLVGGTLIMQFFGISIPGLRIAGGIMISGIGMRMLRPKEVTEQDDEEKSESREKDDISFTPLAMPSLSGPGSIAVTIGLTSLAQHPLDFAAIVIGIAIMAVIALVTLRLSGAVVRVLGVNGMNALTKIMGFLLLCVGIQFIVNGIVGIVTDPAILRQILEGLQAAGG